MHYKKLALTDESKTQINDWQIPSELGFGKVMAPIMAQAEFHSGSWSEPTLVKYGPISLDPSAKVFHYGQEIFEGMKAYRNSENQAFLFRPLMNFKRFNASALRLAMPEVSEELFMNSVESLTYYCQEKIPNGYGQSLYLRPFMIATQPGLGLNISSEYKFLVLASPSGNYFPGEKVRVLIERNDCRAAPGGTGAVKAGGNYGASLLAYSRLKKRGFDQTLWLDAEHKKYVEEFSGMNFFAVIDGELYTPNLSETILPGITRDSIITIARKILGINCYEKPIDIDELLNLIKSGSCTEIFACGTAAVVSPISEIHDQNGEIYHLTKPLGELAHSLKEIILSIQTGQRIPPEDDWVMKIDSL